jgi:hypothetical protein
MSNPFLLSGLLRALPGLIARNELTAEKFLAVWRCDADMRHRPTWSPPEDVPYDLVAEVSHSSVGEKASALLAAWSPNYGIPQPAIVAWLLKSDENRGAFEALDMDRASFVHELLTHSFYGPRMRFEVAQYPYLLNFLPEEERWERLEAAVREYGTAIDWSWPAYTAHEWSPIRTQQLVRRLIESPELAGGFLAANEAHRGWLAFWNLEEFLAVLQTAALVAPYELLLNHEWITTCCGDRRANERSFMDPADIEQDPWYGWWMEPHKVHEHFAPLGQADVAKLIDQALPRAIARPREDLSGISQTFVGKLARLDPELGGPRVQSGRVADLLGYFPDCSFSRTILEQLFSFEANELGTVYRSLFADRRWRLSRVRYYVLGPHEQSIEDRQAKRVRGSWFEIALRERMISRGWRFCSIESRRNKKYREDSDRAYDAQVRIVEGGVTSVYVLWRGSQSNGDYIASRPSLPGKSPQEVMVPPDFNPGEPVHSSDRLRIYRVGERLRLAAPRTDD